MIALIVIPFALCLWHCISWLITKGVIWATAELFDVNWYGKFWAVYVIVIIVSLIFGGGVKASK